MPSVAARPEALPRVAAPWSPCHRLIASRFPTVGLFDRIAAPEDLETVFAIESLTNPRLRDELGEITLVPKDERVVGAGASMIMAAFTHLNPMGSRFSDGRYGVYYAAESLETAVAEVSHHRGLFLARTKEPAIDVDLRWIQARVSAPLQDLHDLRGVRASMPAVYHRDDYTAGQALGRRLRAAGSSGVVYQSVRREGGECVAVFRPRLLSRAVAKGHVALHWDGARITHWWQTGEPRAL